MLHARFSPERLECLPRWRRSHTGVKADAKARAKAEVDASCRDKTQAQALARLMLWSEKSRLNQQVFSGGSVSNVC